jgi:xanthine/CO dehydrogenase XdhC/CoxF family maturation factor
MSNPAPPALLILGKGEIARCLAQLASTLGLSVTVSEPGASEFPWPKGVEIRQVIYADAPWPLAPNTHAVIARGHEADPQSVAALLNFSLPQSPQHSLHNIGAKQIYLIASAKRAAEVIRVTTPLLIDIAAIEQLSAPAGLDLGGNSSMEIALSILAEIQLRHYEKTGQALTHLREQRMYEQRLSEQGNPINSSAEHKSICPGKRV